MLSIQIFCLIMLTLANACMVVDAISGAALMQGHNFNVMTGDLQV
jgi:hypothetical protein